VELTAHNQAWLDAVAREAGGPSHWRIRKQAETRNLLALGQITPPRRMRIDLLDLSEALRVRLLLWVPVPLQPEDNGPLPLADRALLGITYPPEALVEALPGYAFVQILAPARVFHPNAATHPIQALCLGAQLPPGIRLTELILLSYGALSMQTVMLDERDPAGILNHDAARWWQENLDRIPLTREPFLRAEATSRPSPAAIDAAALRSDQAGPSGEAGEEES
jgi:hypothetical protein